MLVNGATADAGQLVHLERLGSAVKIEALSEATLVWLSGEPIPEPIVGHGPFVMNSQEEIIQAMHDYNSGKFGQIVQ